VINKISLANKLWATADEKQSSVEWRDFLRLDHKSIIIVKEDMGSYRENYNDRLKDFSISNL